MQLLHPAIQALIESYGSNLPHGMIISGPKGVGLSGVIAMIVRQLKALQITVLPMKDDTVNLEKGVITVASIRQLYDQTKTISKRPQMVVIDYAERMGPGAQNAFLKLLEEPPVNTYFALLTHDAKVLLPTIHSRTQHIEARPISTLQSEKLLDSLKVLDSTKRSQLLFIADGLPAEIQRLVADEASFMKRAQIVRDARTFVQGRKYEALTLAQKYKDDRTASLVLLEDAMKLLRRSAAKQADAAQVLSKIQALLLVYERIRVNGNVRLQLAASVV